MHRITGQTREFTGVLLSRKYRPGQRYIQLLFKSADSIQLCLSQDVHMVRELRLGQAYHVSGQEAVVAQKLCLRDPAVTLISQPSSKRRVGLVAGVASVVLLLGVGGGVMALQSDETKPTNAQTKYQPMATGQQQTLSEQTEESQPEPTDTATDKPQPSTPTVTPTTPTIPVVTTPSNTTRSSRTTPKKQPAQPAAQQETPVIETSQTPTEDEEETDGSASEPTEDSSNDPLANPAP